MPIIAIDLGGTMIKYGVVTELGQFLFENKIATQAHTGAEAIYQRVIQLIKQLQEQYTIKGVAISTAGQVNPMTKTIVYASEAIPGYTNFAIGERIETETQLPVTVENDVNCALLGERTFGEAVAMNSVMLTIGTGIGGAVMVEDELIHGPYFAAGEIGYIPINGRTFQEQASVSALIRTTEQICHQPTGTLTGHDVFQLAQTNPDVQACIETFYATLAQGIATIIFLLSPEEIIIGGAISQRPEFIMEINRRLPDYFPKQMHCATKITRANLGNRAGMLGALAQFRNQYKN